MLKDARISYRANDKVDNPSIVSLVFHSSVLSANLYCSFTARGGILQRSWQDVIFLGSGQCNRNSSHSRDWP